MTDSCPELVVLEQFSRGALEPTDARVVQEHLSSCDGCRSSLEEVRRNDDLEGTLHRMEQVRRVQDQDLPRIEGYQVEHLIHRGGQGLVFQAVQQSTRRPVAVKLLMASSFLSPRHRRRFLREIELVVHLDHPNIITIHDSGETREGLPFFAMELLPGGPLTRALLERDLPVDARVRAFLPVCSAVSFAHQRGVLHRDLKPGNVLLDGNGQPKVLDFGLAKPIADDRDHTLVTREGEFVGTLAYAAPESFQGDPDLVDVRSDVYSLGVMLYEILTGTLPHDMQGTLVEVARRVTGSDPARPSRRNPRVSLELEAIVMQALAREPERRYPGVASLAEDLERYLAGHTVLARADSGFYVLRKTLWRHRLAVGALSVVFLALLTAAVVSFLFWQDSRAQAQRKERIAAWYRRMIETPDPAAMGPDARVIHMLEAAAADLEEHPDSDPEIAAALAYSIGQTFSGIGLYARARPFLERSAELFVQSLGPDHTETLNARAALASALIGLGEYDRARAVAADLEARHPVQDGDDELSWKLRSIRVELAYFDGQLEDAEREALAWRETALRALGEQHLWTSRASTMLCTTWISQGKYPEAEALLRGELEAAAGQDEFQRHALIQNLAQSLSYQGKDAEAESLFLECLELRTELFGADHDGTSLVRGNLALLYLQQGRFQDAEPLILQSLEVSERQLGRGHPQALLQLNNLAAVRRFQGRMDETEDLLREVVEGRLETSGEDHPDTLTAMHNLGHLLLSRRQFAEAGELLETTWDLRAEKLGEDHPDTLQTRLTLARLLEAEGAMDEAIEHLQEIVDLARPGRWRPARRMTVSVTLVRALLREHRHDEAEEAIAEAEALLDEFEEAPGRERSTLQVLRRELAEARSR